MATSVERIAELEWVNYAATRTLAQVTPGLDVTLREDVVLTSSQAFPTPDTNHACLLRASPERADGLIQEVVEHFETRSVPPVVYVSPACVPADLPERLARASFERQPEVESWMVLERLSSFDMPSTHPGIMVRPIVKSEAVVFAEVFMAAFGMPLEFAPVMAQLVEPTVGAPGVHHYLALDEERPVGTCTLLRYEPFGVLGSVGVVPEHRRGGAATTLMVRAGTDAREAGVATLMLQTSASTPLERLLRISGFRRAFTRTCYVFSDE
jgi:hypothetical protein